MQVLVATLHLYMVLSLDLPGDDPPWFLLGPV